MCGGSRIELVVLAVAAAGPGYVEACVLPKLPEDADLVVLDFGINDFQQVEAEGGWRVPRSIDLCHWSA